MIINVRYLEVIIDIEIQFYYHGIKFTHYSDTGEILHKIKIDFKQVQKDIETINKLEMNIEIK